ncbi:MAG: prepilin peptidase [Lachnospiraceae bacterium]|nr:prepilin peptidase [Lachnospiraceae bacterium]
MKIVEYVDKTAIIAMMTAAVYTDIREGKIYNALTFSFFVGGVCLRILTGDAARVPGILGAAAAVTALLFPFYRLGGIGAGDIKLFAAAGAFMGPLLLAQCVGLAFLIGGAASAVLLLMGKGLRHRMHFAVPIAVSAIALSAVPSLSERITAWCGGL